MSPRLIRLSSRAIPDARVRIYIYPDLDSMRTAATEFAPGDFTNTAGITQAYIADDKTTCLPIIRLAATHLSVEVVAHELHHATTAIYGASLTPHATAKAHLTHHNEPLAYLYGEWFARLTRKLYDHGYWNYDQED